MGCPSKSSQSPEIMLRRRQRDGKNQGWWMMSREQHLPDPKDLVHIWPHGVCVRMPKSCMASNQTQILALRRGRRPWVPVLTNKLFATDTFWKRESLFSPMAYLLGFTAAPMPGKSRPTLNRFHVFLCTFLSYWFYFILRKRHRNKPEMGWVGKRRSGRTRREGK